MSFTRRHLLLAASSVGATALAGCDPSNVPSSPTKVAKAGDRAVARVLAGTRSRAGAGVALKRLLGSSSLPMLDPFLLLDEIKSEDPADWKKGFPSHPHRGFETVTYMIRGAMEHKDSRGNRGLLTSGSAQWMTAGRGIVHSEMPQQSEGLLWGLQLWVNLPASKKLSKPRYQDIAPETIPEIDLGGGRARVVAGAVGPTRGPVDGIVVEPTMLDVSIPAGGSFRHALPATHNAFVYVLEGATEIGPEGTPARGGEIAVLGGGEAASLGSSSGARFLLLAGNPIGEPVARSGPFVMNTEAEVQQAWADYRSGRLEDG